MTRTQRHLGRLAEAAGITTTELRDAIEAVVEEFLGLVPREELEKPDRKTGARMVFGDAHAALSFIADSEGTDVVPGGYEPPPGYHGP